MQGKVLPGYEGAITIGQRKVIIFTGAGPANYNTSTKDIVQITAFPYIDFINDSISVSRNYVIEYAPSVAGPRASWVAIWSSIATGLEVVAGTNLTGESFIGQAFGGDF